MRAAMASDTAKIGTQPIRRSAGFIFWMSMLSLGANLVWISYNSVLLPTLIEDLDFRNPGLVTGMAGFFGMLLAIAASLWAGIASDHGTHRLGKRTPAILLGAAASFPMIILPAFVLSPSAPSFLFRCALPIVLLSYCGMQFFSNVSAGAWYPLLADLFPEDQRGTASGVQGFLSLAGAAIGIILVTFLNQNRLTGLALWFIAGAFALTAVQTARAIRGRDLPAPSGDTLGFRDSLGRMFRVRTRVAVFFWMVLAVLLAFVGINSLQLFARFALQVYFPQIDPDAAFRTLGGINLLMTMLSAAGSGILSDRIGRRTLILGGMIFCAVTSFLMGLTDNYAAFLLLAAIRSVATGPLIAIVPALASDLAPKDEAGQYMAYNNLSTALSGSLASLLFGLILFHLDRASFTHLFFVSGLFFLGGSMIFTFKVTPAALEKSPPLSGPVPADPGAPRPAEIAARPDSPARMERRP
jgi:MFS family permease